MSRKAEAYCRGVSDWAQFPDYDIIWTDPPWGEGMMRLFQRMARLAGCEPSKDDLGAALSSLFRMANRMKPMFVAYGMKGAAVPLGLAEHYGHTLVRITRCIQENGKPYQIFNFNTNGFSLPENTRGFDAVRITVRILRPGVVFDPFAGLGKTAKAVLSEGAGYIGSEMNAGRFKSLKKVCESYAGRA